MRVLIVHNRYARYGGEDRVVEVERAGLIAAGHEVAMHSPESVGLSIPRAGFELATLRNNPLATRQLRRLAGTFKPDVVHVHNLFPRLGLGVLREAHALRLPLVMTMHNYRWLCPVGTFERQGAPCRLCVDAGFGQGVKHACFRGSRILSAAYALALAEAKVRGWPYRLAHRMIFVSEYQRQVYREAGWPIDRSVVKGHFLGEFPVEVPEPGGEGVLFLGRLSSEKGPQVLLDAWRAIDPGANAPILSIAGEGPLESSLRSQSGPTVRWLGFLKGESIAEAIRANGVVVIPSVCPETFSLVAMQAMALGRPVVASRVGGLPEMVREGETGLLVRPNDPRDLAEKINWMLTHPGERQAMGKQARALAVERFGPAIGVAALEAVYKEAIQVARG
jgi:glycosyltransferase involved in cell wall biosynthesis